MRTLPPRQTNQFLKKYDEGLRKGFEEIINSGLNNRQWFISRMSSKYGGMDLKSGIHTVGAQHLNSLINSRHGVTKFVPSWDLHKIARTSTEEWLSQQLGKQVNTSLIINSIERGEKFGSGGALSLAQWCEAAEEKRVISSISSEDCLFNE